MLYLLKGSRVQEYHQQNVAIVGAAESDRFEITYSDRWIAPGVEVTTGDGCVIVFADSPYEHFVPVRFGVIESADREDGRLRLQVRVTAPVRAGGTEKLNALFAQFDRDDPDRPGKRFLFNADNPDLESPQSDSDHDLSWAEIIDRLRPNGYFEHTTFTRIRRLVTADGRPLERGRTVSVGEDLVVELETRTPSHSIESISLYVESEPKGSIEHGDVGAIEPTGIVRLPFRVTAPGIVRATVRTLPEPLKSSRSSFDVVAEAASEIASSPQRSSAVAPVSEAPGSVDLTSLMKFLDRRGGLDAEAWVGLSELLLRDFSDSDPAVLSRLARATFELGRYEECVRALCAIEARRPDEELQLVLAALLGGVEIDFEAHLVRMDIEKDADFAALLAALEQADRVVLERVTRALFGDVLGDERGAHLVERVFPRIQSVDLAVSLADAVAHVEPLTGARLLFDRWPPDKAPERAIDLLLDWQVGENRLAPYFGVRTASLVAARRFDELCDLVEPARRVLSGRELLATCREIGEALLESGSPEHEAIGFDLLIESINEEIADGQFDTAAVLAQQLLGHSLVAGDDVRADAATALLELSLAEILGSREYMDWMAFVSDSATKRLRPSMTGKSLHVVGGQQFDWLAELQDELALSDARWHVSEKHKGIDHDWVNHLDPDRDVVIVITEFIGHALSNPIKEKCERNRITRLDGRPTKKGILDALDRHYGTNVK